MSGYGPVRKGRIPTPVVKPYDLDYDAIINSIIDLKNDDAVRAKALKYKREKGYIFLERGDTTSDYKNLLIRILERFTTFTREQLQRISLWLFCWEEHALTGIMKVEPTEPIYNSYVELLEKAFGNPIKYKDKNGHLDLANSTIVLIINEIVKPCQYGNSCYRIKSNPLHAKWKHPPANAVAAASVAAVNAPANAAANAQGGKRRQTLRKRSKQKKNKRTQSNTRKI